MSEPGTPKPLTWHGKENFALAREAIKKYWAPASLTAGGMGGFLYLLLIQDKL